MSTISIRLCRSTAIMARFGGLTGTAYAQQTAANTVPAIAAQSAGGIQHHRRDRR